MLQERHQPTTRVKAYLLSFSEGLRMSLSDTMVTVTVLCPGPTRGTRFNWSTSSNTASEPWYGLSAEDVARAAYNGFMRKKSIVIPGFRFVGLYWFSRLLPRQWSLAILKMFQ